MVEDWAVNHRTGTKYTLQTDVADILEGELAAEAENYAKKTVD
ncbi:hypothetical protein GCM10025785_18470 [Corynebacterium canis]